MTEASSTPTPPAAGYAAPPASDLHAGTDAAAHAAGPLLPARGRLLWANLNHPFAVGFTLTLGGLAALLLGLALSNLSTVIIYIVFALFIALGLDPVVRRLEKTRISRAWSIVVVYLAFALVLVGVLLLVVPIVVRQIAQFVTDLPDLIQRFQRSDIYAWLQNNFGDSVSTILAEAQKFLTDPANIAAIGGGVLQVGLGIAAGVSGVVIIIVLSLYFVATLPSIKRSFYRLAPARHRERVADLTGQITDSIGGYLMGMVVLAFCNSVVAFLLYVFLRLPFPALMAVVAFCVTLIPLVGSVLFWGIGSLLALFSNPLLALVFAAAYLVYIQLEAYVLTPRVMNRTIAIPGSLVVIGALVGGTLLGLLGALVAIPVTASILLIIKQVVIPRQDAKV